MRGKAGQRQPKGRFWNKNWNLFHPRLMGREARDTGEEKGAEHPPPPSRVCQGGRRSGCRRKDQNPEHPNSQVEDMCMPHFLVFTVPASATARLHAGQLLQENIIPALVPIQAELIAPPLALSIGCNDLFQLYPPTL